MKKQITAQTYRQDQKGALKAIEKVFEISKDSQLKPEIFDELQAELEFLGEFTQLTPLQNVLFSNALFNSYRRNDFCDIFSNLGLKEISMLYYTEDIEELFVRNYLYNRQTRHNNSYSFEINKSVLNHISNNTPLRQKNYKLNNFIELLEEFWEYNEEFEERNLNAFDLKRHIEALLNKNKELSLVKKINSLKLDIVEIYLLLVLIYESVEAVSPVSVSILTCVSPFSRGLHKGVSISNKIAMEKSKLSSENIIELGQDMFRDRVTVRLTNEFVEFFNTVEGEFIQQKSPEDVGNNELILPEDIQKKKLFYSKTEENNIARIEGILSEKNFLKLKDRLEEHHMPGGVTVLFYGYPGTGKTESIFQIAKATGRKVIKVDIASKKSAWYGESQKLIKEIFTKYDKICKSEEKTPILLFNEADALLSKRKINSEANTAQTENAIQNIFLQEMEDFKGIMMATTNLIENLDSAFERRFLFKVGFQKPSAKNAAQIWQTKIPELTADEALKLAKEYELSGGQIENIARKFLIEKMVLDKEVNFKLIDEFCKTEKWSHQPQEKSIGF